MVNIAIVEDNTDVRETVQLYLNGVADFKCNLSFGSAENALAGIIINRPQLIIMDIGLPGMSGIEGMVKIKEQYPEALFLMFTVFEDDEYVFEALKSGADGYLLKKEPLTKIERTIRDVLNNGAPMSKSIARKVLHSFREEKLDNGVKERLSTRQIEIIELLSKGYPYKVIAGQLSVTVGTIKQHVHQIYKKLEVNNKTEAINKYLSRE